VALGQPEQPVGAQDAAEQQATERALEVHVRHTVVVTEEVLRGGQIVTCFASAITGMNIRRVVRAPLAGTAEAARRHQAHALKVDGVRRQLSEPPGRVSRLAQEASRFPPGAEAE
jgi:hypothetical protein